MYEQSSMQKHSTLTPPEALHAGGPRGAAVPWSCGGITALDLGAPGGEHRLEL
jgi:hypothetical protein